MTYPGRISAIILMHNNAAMTGTCLQSLAGALAGFDHEVILLDNGSTQDTGELDQYGGEFRRFRIIRSEENLTFSIGNNRCVAETSGERLLFLNNDVFLNRDSIQQLIQPMQYDAGIGATGGKLLYPGSESVQHAGIGQMLWDHPSNYGVGAWPGDSRLQEKRPAFALSGAMLCVDRGVFESVGGFDERYIWGTEDIDLCMKIRAAGRAAVYCPDAVAVHHESATLKGSNRCAGESNCRIFRNLWDAQLVPAEQRYVSWMKDRKIRTVAVFGMGTAARGLARILDNSGIEIVAFTSSNAKDSGDSFLNRPVIPLSDLKAVSYDRLVVATQYFFAVEPLLREYDPEQQPIYPMLN